MSEPLTASQPLPARNPWPRTVAFVALLAGAVFLIWQTLLLPSRMAESAGGMLEKGGRQLRQVAQAFQQGTVRTEFVSQAAEVVGMSRFQFATLRQNETFRREDSGSMAWGWIPLPKVVVQAQAPVEYSYYLDFAAPWEFLRVGPVIQVFTPPMRGNTPALDVSALTFHTLEGSVWRDEAASTEKLRASLTAALQERAAQNANLVREVGRTRLAAFVEKWLAEKFSDGGEFRVQVIFPDERAVDSLEARPPAL